MTNAAPPDEPPSPRFDAFQWSGNMAGILFLIALSLGVLRAVLDVATGPGGVVPRVEAAYSLLLYTGVGLLVGVSVRASGFWLSLAERRAAFVEPRRPERREPVAPPVEAPAPAPPLDPVAWRERLHAAREADDPARVLELRDEPPAELEEGTLKELDADLGKWLISLVHRRLRTGPLRADLVTLVERGSETLGHTKEGASLRAALPTLRRGIGLCPRCGKPYAGVWEACPECMGRPEPPPPEIPGLPATDVDDLQTPSTDGRWFVDPDVDGRPGG